VRSAAVGSATASAFGSSPSSLLCVLLVYIQVCGYVVMRVSQYSIYAVVDQYVLDFT
jgi:hypothetical protein